MTAAIATAPSLSRIQAWSTNHLESAALQWTETAKAWEHAFAAVHREAVAPGGATWLGEAAALRTGADQAVVNRATDILEAAAKAARRGVDDIDAARQLDLRVIDVARAAGFVVGEDLSVRSQLIDGTPALQAARQAQAEMLATEIRARAEKLVAVDAEVGSSVMSSIESLTGADFDEAPLEKPVIQAVDYAPMPESPIPDPGLPGDPVGRGAGPTGAEIWSVIAKLPQGDNARVREVRTSQDLQKLWEWMRRGATQSTESYKGSEKGAELHLPDGSRIGQRRAANSSGRPAIDVSIPGRDYVKVHINSRGGIPEIPRLEAAPPRVPAAGESPAGRGSGLPGRVGGGGVLPDNTLPDFIEPPQTKQNPVIGDGIPDPER